VTAHQIAETIGCDVDYVIDVMPIDKFWDWAVYLNSPFSRRSREATMNGWLIQVIRSMMAPKGKKPQFKDSIFPFHKVAESYFENADLDKKQHRARSDKLAGGQHRTYMLRKKFEKAQSDWRAGKIQNAYGLYRGETVKQTKPKRRGN
jgi:hypothetical protein